MAKGNGKEPKGGGKKQLTAEIAYPEMTEEEQPLYANAVLINHTPWDFALHFNRVVMPVKNQGEVGKLRIQARKVAVINIPPTLIPGFIEALQTNLARYESSYGKIDTPRLKGEQG